MSHPRYKLNDDSVVPSVTTIISRFKDGKGLIHWAHKQGAAGLDLYETRDQAGNTGTMTHDMIEADVLGVEPAVHTAHEFKVTQERFDEMLAAAGVAYKGFIAWRQQSTLEIVATETSLVHEALRFGGTPDAVCLANGELCMLDYKTSNRIYADYLIQVAAYCGLWAEGHMLDPEAPPPPRLGERLSTVHLLRIGKQYGDFHHHCWPVEVLRIGWRQFVLFREAYDLAKDLDKAL